jgi:hypothetical protein
MIRRPRSGGEVVVGYFDFMAVKTSALTGNREAPFDAGPGFISLCPCT